MQAGIEAVMDAVAPPVRAAQDASVPADAPSFDDHLEAAGAQATPPTAETDAEAPSADKSDPEAVAQTQPQPAPQQQNFTAAALVLQVVEAVVDTATSPGNAAVGDVEAAAPQQSAAPPPAAPTAPPAPAAPKQTAKRNAEAATNQAPAPEAEPAATMGHASGEASIDAAPPINEDSAAADAPAQRAPQSQSTPATASAAAQQAQSAQAGAPQPLAPSVAPITAKPSAPVKAETRVEAKAATALAAKPPALQQSAAEPVENQSATPTPERDVQKAAAPSAAPRDSFTAPPPSQQQAGVNQQQQPPALSLSLSTSPAAASSAIQTLIPHAAAPAATQVTREIIRKFDGANTRFELRLDPPELGRVEVKLEVSRDHRVTAIVAADSPQALAELTRHARDIEQALQSSGLELSDEGLSFDLSQHRQNLDDDSEHQGGGRPQQTSPQDLTPVPSRALTLDAWRGARVDLVA